MSRMLRVLLAGELRMQLRQPLSLVLVLLLPLLAGAGAVAASDAYLQSVQETFQPEGEREPLTVRAPPELAAWLVPEDELRVVAEGEASAEVEIDGGHVIVRFHPDAKRGRAARDRLEQVITRREHQLLDERLAGAPFARDRVLRIEREDLAIEPPGRPGLGSVLPIPLVTLLTMIALYTAVDVVTGERERKTAETLLTTPADTRLVIAAKLIVVCATTVIASVWMLGGLVLGEALGLVGRPEILEIGVGVWLGVAALCALVALQVSAVCVALASYVPDYRAASLLSAPLMLGLLALAGVSALPSVSLQPALAVLPITNVSLAIGAWVRGEAGVGTLALVGAASVLHATAAIALAVRALRRDEALIGASRPGRRQLGWYGADAAGLFVLVLLLTWFFGQLAQARDLVWGMVFTQLALFAGVAFAAIGYLGLPARSTLSLRPPRAIDLGFALVAAACAPAVGHLALAIQEPFLPMSGQLVEQLGKIADVEIGLATALLTFAVLPGICEELLFRGALLGLLRRSLPAVPRALVVAALFGALHLSVHRFLPTASLGLLITVAVMRSGSLWTGVLVHIANNGLLILAAHQGWIEAPSLPAMVAGTAVAVAAVAAMGRAPAQGSAVPAVSGA